MKALKFTVRDGLRFSTKVAGCIKEGDTAVFPLGSRIKQLSHPSHNATRFKIMCGNFLSLFGTPVGKKLTFDVTTYQDPVLWTKIPQTFLRWENFPPPPPPKFWDLVSTLGYSQCQKYEPCIYCIKIYTQYLHNIPSLSEGRITCNELINIYNISKANITILIACEAGSKEKDGEVFIQKSTVWLTLTTYDAKIFYWLYIPST